MLLMKAKSSIHLARNKQEVTRHVLHQLSASQSGMRMHCESVCPRGVRQGRSESGYRHSGRGPTSRPVGVSSMFTIPTRRHSEHQSIIPNDSLKMAIHDAASTPATWAAIQPTGAYERLVEVV
jgi:hypothetical protein